ncbi:MAG: hypothetical protein ACSHWY_00230 [Octadecabacter sp.]
MSTKKPHGWLDGIMNDLEEYSEINGLEHFKEAIKKAQGALRKEEKIDHVEGSIANFRSQH